MLLPIGMQVLEESLAQFISSAAWALHKLHRLTFFWRPVPLMPNRVHGASWLRCQTVPKGPRRRWRARIGAVLGITALQACLDSVAHAAEGHPQAGLLMWLVAIELARGTVL